ncbi:MAG: peptide-methionine (R)-S-oxide reductase MsrB [Lewinellaceae bacterium]|nr:peptide-methionine (R)-S-oxide reductase MsrB [Lewinellaceae bacterium]
MHYTILFLAFFACNFSQRTTPSGTPTGAAVPGLEATTDSIVPPAYDANNRLIRVTKTDTDWKKELDELEYNVLRQEGTERAFTGDLVKNKQKGTYTCRGCRLPLFSSDTKFDSGTGWPSYWKPLKPEYVTENQDRAYGMLRTEVECARCGGHLGHVFDDGPKPTGLRYCINSVSLDFVRE